MLVAQGIWFGYRASSAPSAQDDADAAERCASLGRTSALAGVDLAVSPGEIVSLIGPNGSGKSTLGRVLSLRMVPEAGVVTVDGIETVDGPSRASAQHLIGMVVQEPQDQIVSSVVRDEVEFGPRNLGLDAGTCRARADRALAAVGLAGFEGRATAALSGGEQQRLALAGMLAMGCRYLVLDEVTAMVDSAERPRLRSLVRELARDRGVGIVQITHDPIEALSCDKVVVLEEGAVRWCGSPRELASGNADLLERTLLQGPYARALVSAMKAGFDTTCGAEPEDLARWAKASPQCLEMLKLFVVEGASGTGCVSDGGAGHLRSATQAADTAALVAHGLTCAYDGTEVVHGVDIRLDRGEVALMAGPSGSGKSTIAAALAGLMAPASGSVELDGETPRPGRVSLVFQHPENQFFLESVSAELAFAPRNLGCTNAEVAVRVREAAVACALDDCILAADPFALSGGQARRAALASMLTARRDVLILDEPTSGLDAMARVRLHELVRKLARAGRAILVISHDLEEWLGAADRVVLVREGRIAYSGMPCELAGEPGIFSRAGIVAPECLRLAALLGDARADSMRSGAVGTPQPDTVSPASHRDESQHGLPVGVSDVAAAAGHDGAAAPRRLRPGGRLDARVKIGLLLVAVVGVFTAQTPALVACWYALLAAAAVASGIAPARMARSIRPAAFLLAVIILVNLVSCDGTADLLVAGQVGLSAAGARRAGMAVARIIFMVAASLVVSETTVPTDIADSCVRLGRPLKRLGVPVEDIGLVLSLALRFIPLVNEELMRIRRSQEVRGASFDEGPLMARLRVWLSVLTPLVVGLFRRSERLAEAMDARCFGTGVRAETPPAPLSARDRTVLAGGIIVMSGLIAASYLMA